MKKVFLMITLAGFLVVIYQNNPLMNAGSRYTEASPYSLAFRSVGANLLESRLDCWATITTNSSSSDMRKLLAKIARSLGTECQPEKFSINIKNKITLVRASINKGNEKLYLTAQSDGKQTYVLISVITKEARNLDAYEEAIDRVIPTRSARLYTAVLDGCRGPEERLGLVRSVFHELRARQVEIYRDQTVVSATGISSLINTSLGEGTRRYNVQAAVSSDETQDKTYIYLGTPLILGEY